MAGELFGSFSDVVFGFLDDGEGWSLSSPESLDYENNELDEDREGGGNCGGVEEKKKYWDTQHQLLEGTLCRSSFLESRIRNSTKEIVKDARRRGNLCIRRRAVDNDGFMTEVFNHLQNAGFNCAIRKTKWRNSPDILAGMQRLST